MTEIQYIDRQDAWEQAANTLSGQPILALDTESNSMHAYRERLCLIQIAHPNGVIILDPLAVPDLSSLGHLLACPATLKTLHGAPYDLTCLYRQHQFRLENLFDTEIAARFLGLPNTNLAAVLQTCLHLSIPKNPALQRSDWSQRPLSPDALAYAAADVTHLPRLTALLRAHLQQLARLPWVAEECQRMTQSPTQPAAPAEPAFLRTKGAYRLTPRQLAVLRELWQFRETEAQRRNLPPFKILNPQTLLRLAQSPHPAGPSPEAAPAIPPRHAPEIAAAIARGWSAPEFHPSPDSGRKPQQTPESATRLRGLKNWRDNRAAALKINPSLIWPTRSLERIAADPPQPSAQSPDHDNPEVRRWQRQEFGPELNALCASRQWRQGQTVTPPPSHPKPAPVA